MGVLGVFKDSVTLVNRTSRKLNVRYDGEDITVEPGENPGFPLVAVPYAKKQNPLMGSKHPINPNKYICLVGVKGTKDDVTPIPDEVLEAADKEYEVLDRDGKPIAGLFAVGLDQNSIMKGTYPGGGSSIGPAMTFAYRAARRIAGENERGHA